MIAWTTDPLKQFIVASSPVSTFQVRLPAGNDPTSLLHLIIRIRDTRECITESNMTSIHVVPDLSSINNLISDIQSSSADTMNDNPIVRLLNSGDQNTVCQLTNSLSQWINTKNNEDIDKAALSKYQTYNDDQ